MRTVILLALVALLSGCTSSSSGDDVTDPVPDSSEAEPVSPPAKQPAVVFEESTWGAVDIIVVPGVPAYFQVDVPEGGRNATVVFDGAQAALRSVTVSLEGCGSATRNMAAASPNGLYFTVGLCNMPEPGRHQVDIEITGIFNGEVSVQGSSPH